jgi:1,4-dihydroxy-6-naphthoate synthase
MNLTLGYSPCPNDTFIFAAMVNGWIDTQGLTFTVNMQDVERLNEWVSGSRLDITKMSFHRGVSSGHEYALLNSGAALGVGCGPLLISKQQVTSEQILKGPVLLPGRWTTAHLLFNMFYPGCRDKRFVLFSEIEDQLVKEKAIAGVIIHENRFTYQSKGLVKIKDLGEAWEEKTGLPIPLGGIYISNKFDEKIKSKVEELIVQSIKYAYQNPERVMPYVRQFAQEMNEKVMMEHIRLYVNNFSLDLGEKGQLSLHLLKDFAE